MGEPSSMSRELAALRASRDLLREVSTTSDLTRTCRAILEAACQVEGIDCGGIYLVEQGTGSLRLTAHHGLPPWFIDQTAFYADDAPEAALVRAGQAIYLDQAGLSTLEHVPSAHLCRAAGLQAVAVLPVQLDGRVVAALNLGSHTLQEIPIPIRDALEVMTAPLGGALGRVQMEAALRQANLVVENSPVVLFRWKAATGWPVEYVSGNVIQFGYTPQELLTGATPYTSLVHPDDLTRVAQEVQRYSASGMDRFQQEYRILTKDGGVRWVDDRTAIERDAGGRITHYQGILIDITDRHQADAAIRSRTDQLEAVRTISMEITRELDFPRLLNLITRRAVDLVSAASGGVHLWDETAQVLVPRAWAGTLAPWQEEVRYRLGEGVVGTVAQRGEGLIVNDYRRWAAALPIFLERTDIAAVLAEPLLYQGRLLGVIAITRPTGKPFADEDQQLLRLFAAQAAIAIENARAHEAALQRGEQLEALLRASRMVMAGLDLQGTLEQIVAEASQIARSKQVKLLLVDPEARMLRVSAAQGVEAPPDLAWPVGHGLSGSVASRGEPLFLADSQDESLNPNAAFDREKGLRTYLGIPVKAGQEVLGVLTFNTTEPRTYSAEELIYLTAFADQAAIAIENARLYEAAQRELAERKKAEQTLRAHQDRLEALLHGSLELAQIQPLERLVGGLGEACARLLNADGGDVRIVEGNDLVKIVGWGDHEAVGSPLRLPMGQGLSGGMAARGEPMIVDRLAEDERLSPQSRESFRHLGHQAWFGVPVKLGDRLLGTLNMWSRQGFSPEDIATATAFAAQAAIALENARLYAEVRASFEQLQHAQATLVQGEKLRALGQMAAGIAHDLNNMLAAILGQSELIRLHTEDPVVQTALEILYTAASDGARVVRRLQGFGRQKPEGPLVLCDLATLVNEALALTRPRWKDEAERENRLIQVWTALDNLPQVQGEPSEIREALTNIILNAVDAMPTGGSLRVTGHAEVAPGSSADASGVVLRLQDTGTGMPEEVRRQIFDPFFTTKGLKGTGLGLAMVYGILQRHGGTIEVASSPGQGTTFTLRFPVAPRHKPIAPETESAVVPKTARLLVIDDEPLVRQSIASLLRAVGHEVIEAENGSEGLRLLGETRVDLVLSDLGMPGMTGWEVAKQVKAAHPRLPVVLLTGWGQQFPEHLPAQSCVDQVLTKPIRLEDLQQVVVRLTT